MTGLARVEVDDSGDACTVSIIGEVDVSNGAEVGRELERAFGNRLRRCIVDLSATQYLDSVGLRLLFEFAERLRSRGAQLHVVVPVDAVIRSVLVRTGMPSIAPLLDVRPP